MGTKSREVIRGGQIIGAHVGDASLVNIACCNVSSGDKIAEGLRGFRVVFIEISGHLHLVGFRICVWQPDKHGPFDPWVANYFKIHDTLQLLQTCCGSVN